ncbi:G-type lectin S-receptor-like serine/threonine-protein kinase B120 [Asparagus officinalis]|uniref:G-type lectin S-receptor-like serine/threonine-protein kinase B120 n=1 Tax=Asparagus officinalis TaxID=4686 RepID=UPI00098E0EA4|nr:G-type lectin S-receptor-like serine/threonine-protein kinase B120 [Asparagus officinalis]
MNSTKRTHLLSSLLIFINTTVLSRFSLANDTLTQGQSIKDGQTLLSSSKIFDLGFFSPGNSTSRYLGVYYHNISTQSVVWVANRGTPITNSGGILTLTSSGNLLLLNDQGNLLWSTKSNPIVSNTSVTARILDSGELVIGSGDGTVIWSSFDHPTDTFLPGMKVSLDRKTGTRTVFRAWKSPNDPSKGKYSLGLDLSGSGQIFIWKGRRPRWRSGQWDGTRFIGSTMRPLYLYGFKPIVDNSQNSMYFTFTQFNSTPLRFVLQWDGVENTSILVEQTKDWRSVWVQPVNECETYGKCRDYGICSSDRVPICSCLRGFEPRFSEEYNSGNWSGGCVRKNPLQCELVNSTNRSNKNITGGNGQGDGFYKLQAVKVPDLADWQSTVVNGEDCRSSCLKNCSCKAYSYVSGIGCLFWGPNLIDIYQFPQGSGSDLYIKVAGSELGKRC